MSKGARNRKAHMIAETREANFQQVIEWVRRMDDMPDGEYCTHCFSTEHIEDCTQDAPMADKYDLAIFAVRTMWNRENMDEMHVTFNMFEVKSIVASVIEVMRTHLGITQEQLDDAYKETLLANLIDALEEHAPQVRAQRQANLIARTMPPLPGADPFKGIFGANGKPIGQG